MKKFIIFILSAVITFSIFADNAYWPDKDWRESYPEKQGVDSQLIYNMFNEIKMNKLPVHNVLLIRNGFLITEANFGEFERDTKHPVYSGTKSFTSILVGIAIDEGYIKDVNQKVIDFFPEKKEEKKNDKYWNALTIEHLLKMSFGHKDNSLPTMKIYNDKNFNAVDNIFNTVIENEPGKDFFYDNGSPHLLSVIVQKTTGKTLAEYAKEKLFEPLGISDFSWDSDNQGFTIGNTSLQLRPYDLAKVAYMMLNDGKWKDRQIISKAWVSSSTKNYMKPNLNEAENFGYGYFWWINSFGGFSAHGFAGQFIIVEPNLNLIAVITGAFSDPVFPTNHNLIRDYIIPAVKSKNVIKDNKKAFKNLGLIINEIKNLTMKKE